MLATFWALSVLAVALQAALGYSLVDGLLRRPIALEGLTISQ